MEHLLPGHKGTGFQWISSSFHGPGTLFRNIKIIKSSTPNQVKLRRLEKTVGSEASGPQLRERSFFSSQPRPHPGSSYQGDEQRGHFDHHPSPPIELRQLLALGLASSSQPILDPDP